MEQLEHLKQKVDEFKKSLDELKNNISISETEKKAKVEVLKSEAEATKQKIEAEISALANKMDKSYRNKKEKAESLLNSINETLKLYTSILSWSTNTTKTISIQPSTENKNIFTKTKNRIWEQRDAIFDKTKWELGPEWWKNLLRTAWFVASWAGAIALAYKWVKGLWNWAFWKKEKKAKEKNNETKKEDIKKKDSDGKKWFWNRWYWKVLKRTWITGGAWLWTYFFGKYLNLRWNNKGNSINQAKIKNQSSEQQENFQQWWDKISDEMFEQLLKMEGKHEEGDKLVAKTGKQFWEKFPTWPYGMVYKHIDNEGNLLKKSVPFKEWEAVTKEWAMKNARACYDKRAKEIKEAFDKKWYNLSQNQLDALTSTCGWTSASRKNCLNFVLENRNDQKKVIDYISTHATTAAWNGQVQPGLVYRRKFEADWFVWNKMTFAEHRAMQKKWDTYDSYLAKNGTQKDKNVW